MEEIVDDLEEIEQNILETYKALKRAQERENEELELEIRKNLTLLLEEKKREELRRGKEPLLNFTWTENDPS